MFFSLWWSFGFLGVSVPPCLCLLQCFLCVAYGRSLICVWCFTDWTDSLRIRNTDSKHTGRKLRLNYQQQQMRTMWSCCVSEDPRLCFHVPSLDYWLLSVFLFDKKKSINSVQYAAAMFLWIFQSFCFGSLSASDFSLTSWFLYLWSCLCHVFILIFSAGFF